MVICFPFLDVIDHFTLTHHYAPVVVVLVPLALALCYPTLDKWSTARGDTTLILAVTSGLGVGNWFCYQYGFMQRATTLPPYEIIYPTWQWFGQMLLRLALGVVILIATRTIMKLLSYNLICYLLGVNKEDMKSHQKLSVELPYKFATYMVVAFNFVWLSPQVFRYLGIERETYFTEL
jgi:sphingosine-1-phosphate phosphatase 1